jgi:hypothetical protein
MYLIFNKRNGDLSRYGLGVISEILAKDLPYNEERLQNISKGIGKMKVGEYCHIMHFTIVRSAPGVTEEELAARK